MDFSNIDVEAWADEGAEMCVKHPVTGSLLEDANGENVSIWLKGLDSPEAKSIAKAASNALQNGDNAKLEKQGLDLLAKITMKWSNVSWEGKALECNPKNVRFFYKKRDWVAAQVLEFAKNRHNFFTEPQSD